MVVSFEREGEGCETPKLVKVEGEEMQEEDRE